MRTAALGALLAVMTLYGTWFYACRYTENRIAAETQPRIASLNAYSAKLQSRLDYAEHHIQTRTVTLKERIPYAITKIVYQDRVVDRPDYYFTRAQLLCWNASLGLADASTCPDPKTSGPEAFALTGTDIGDGFSNINDNGSTCQLYRTVALGWQEWWGKVSGQRIGQPEKSLP